MNRKKIILFFMAAVILVTIIFIGLYAVKQFSKPIVDLKGEKYYEFYIPTGSDYDFVKTSLITSEILNDEKLFDLLATKKNYPKKVKPGRYHIFDQMTANELINMLRSGNQAPIRFTFTNIRFVDKLAGLAQKKMELDSAQLSDLFHDDRYLEEYGFDHQTVVAMFLPNTYEFYWNTSADDFMNRMYKEYNRFWNKERVSKARDIGLNPIEVSILASIVQEETNQSSEMATIAGVYINRLDRGMLLQADPTARFAYGDFSIKRVTYDYLKIDSPYNTYVYSGLPPGPICMPNSNTIDKVLNYEKHKYIFFCAKPDNSGLHAFAKTNSEHNRNARAYHRYLNKNRIR